MSNFAASLIFKGDFADTISELSLVLSAAAIQSTFTKACLLLNEMFHTKLRSSKSALTDS